MLKTIMRVPVLLVILFVLVPIELPDVYRTIRRESPYTRSRALWLAVTASLTAWWIVVKSEPNKMTVET